MSTMILVIYFAYLFLSIIAEGIEDMDSRRWLGLSLLFHALVLGCALSAAVLGVGGAP